MRNHESDGQWGQESDGDGDSGGAFREASATTVSGWWRRLVKFIMVVAGSVGDSCSGFTPRQECGSWAADKRRLWSVPSTTDDPGSSRGIRVESVLL